MTRPTCPARDGYNVLLTVTDNEGNIGGFENVVPVLPASCTGFSCPLVRRRLDS